MTYTLKTINCEEESGILLPEDTSPIQAGYDMGRIDERERIISLLSIVAYSVLSVEDENDDLLTLEPYQLNALIRAMPND